MKHLYWELKNESNKKLTKISKLLSIRSERRITLFWVFAFGKTCGKTGSPPNAFTQSSHPQNIQKC